MSRKQGCKNVQNFQMFNAIAIINELRTECMARM